MVFTAYLREADIAAMEDCIKLHEVRRFFLRAGLYLATDATTSQARTTLVAFVADLLKRAQGAMELDGRMEFVAKDIRAALAFIDPRLRIYGLDNVTDEPSQDDDASNSDDESDADDSSSESDSDADDEVDRQVEEALGDEPDFGDGDFSDSEEAGNAGYTAAFAREDALWINENGVFRLENGDAETASAAELDIPYLIPRSAFVSMCAVASNLTISRAGLSALHSAAEHFLFKELENGKLGSDIACTMLQDFVTEQAAERAELEAQIATQAAQLTVLTAKLDKFKQDKMTPRKSLALSDGNTVRVALKDKFGTPRKRLSSEMLQENQPPTPQSVRYR
ncbi:hypothetical protein ACHHYP_09602 [Achlya hypogyna]|uniref:Uncharacterized protein n=1 Tax=Achlya hypogyna TaxID=1202772 RepID=A0A1V9YMW7_ACHHY|nr:hypothetical protein ACHHYP_09602 [Achlya hypogyna]